MSALAVIASATMLAETVRMTVPYACAALGGIISERSGVVNIALEGTLLGGALASVAVALATGSMATGAAAGVAAGAMIGLVHALLVVGGRIDMIVSGLAINLAVAGGTRFILRLLYGSSSNSPSLRLARDEVSDGWFRFVVLDPFVVLIVVLTAVVAWALLRTRFGLRLRACGEDPAAALAVGIDVTRMRIASVVLGGAVCGLGGAGLALELHQFQAGMSGGRGFIALAAVIVSGWRPWRALGACFVFAALDALQIVLQNQTRIPTQFFAVLPFAATLFALVAVSRRGARGAQPPAGLGKHAT